MRQSAVFGAILGMVAGPALADDACKEAVAAAFTKQRGGRVFTMASELKTPSGPVHIVVDYAPPDRMRQTITAPGQDPLETTLVGQRAYSRQGSNWQELMPAVAQTIIAQMREAAIEPPKDVGNFDCVGTTTLDGKEYLAYRSVEKQADAGAPTGSPVMHRTIYVDPKTGLPARNVVAGEQAGSEAVFNATYEYPETVDIEDHPDAPLVKPR